MSHIYNRILLVVIVVFIFGMPSIANANISGLAETETAPIQELIVAPDGESLKGTVLYKDGCYVPWTELRGIEDDVLVLAHMAKVRDAMCIFGMEILNVAFPIDDIPNGTYLIRDGHDGASLGSLEVSNNYVEFQPI